MKCPPFMERKDTAVNSADTLLPYSVTMNFYREILFYRSALFHFRGFIYAYRAFNKDINIFRLSTHSKYARDNCHRCTNPWTNFRFFLHPHQKLIPARLPGKHVLQNGLFIVKYTFIDPECEFL